MNNRRIFFLLLIAMIAAIVVLVVRDRLNTANTGAFCGGIVNIACPSGQFCTLDGSYPDAGGKCVK